MRILFEDRANLSPHLADWLKWITEPSMDLRLKSAKQALEALEKSSLQERSLTIATKPVGSKVQVTNTRQMLEIFIPPRGFHRVLIPLIGFAIAWNCFLVNWYGIAFAYRNSVGGFLALFGICQVGAGLGMIWVILVIWSEKVRLRITQSEISLSSEIILGLRSQPLLIETRQNITKVELTRLSYKKDSEGNSVAVPPQIIIWAGTKKFSLGGDGRLTPSELDWLAQNLSSWLNLPITKEQ